MNASNTAPYYLDSNMQDMHQYIACTVFIGSWGKNVPLLEARNTPPENKTQNYTVILSTKNLNRVKTQNCTVILSTKNLNRVKSTKLVVKNNAKPAGTTNCIQTGTRMIVAQGTIDETIKDTCSQGLLSAMTLPLRSDRLHCVGGKNILTHSRKVGINANFIATRAFCPTHLQPSCPSSLPFFQHVPNSSIWLPVSKAFIRQKLLHDST